MRSRRDGDVSIAPTVAETPEQFYERVADDLRMPPVDEWDTFPFDGDLRPRALQPPVEHEEPRYGEAGVDCRACGKPVEDYLWTTERWRLLAVGPTGLPVVLILEPRQQNAEPGDLPDELAAECGVLLGRIERAIRSSGEIGRVHVCRWGDGSEHLHWWFMARPARIPQLVGSFAAIWDDIVPPVPKEIWDENLDAVLAVLADSSP
jgi:diadenosine tetraphosphate (Ap4A) HIT family hydrolase